MKTLERNIIDHAVDNAMCFGTGWLTAAEEAIEDEGIEFSEAHERYAFDAAMRKMDETSIMIARWM